ncbi:MAG: hypothetical protein CL843_00295 [Crocinitomicaceae bacterium]|nr:hypothetical protein [Crocinitomicaceae bacterium]|tara:strand:+ start:426 stop:878 length:453 start_codon:yes stop_codon:yes gene_type:complete
MNKIIKILHIEPSISSSREVEKTLAGMGYQVEYKRIETRNEIERIIPIFTPDVLISEFQLRGFDGNEVLERVSKVNKNLPVIFFTDAASTVKEKLELLKKGATYVLEKSKLDELELALFIALKTNNASDQAQKQNAIEWNVIRNVVKDAS